MAKVSGPLMSLDARGKFAGALVFSGWKGRPTVRQLVTPSNPMSADQVTARNRQRITAAAQHYANLETDMLSGKTATDKALLTAAAPAGQAWNGFLVKSMIGAGALTYDAAAAAWTALTAGEKTAWNDDAAALTPAIASVPQYSAGNVAGTPATGGQVYFHYIYGLYAAGILADAPTGTPPTRA